MGEPTIVWDISLGVASALQNPKSANLTYPLWRRILAGLRSLCIILFFIIEVKAATNYLNILSASCSGSIFYPVMISSSVPPLQYS